MATVIKSPSGPGNTQRAAYNLNDISHQVDRYLEQARAESEKILANARQEAENIRQQAEAEGRQAAMDAMQAAIEKKVGEEMQSLMPALDRVIEDLGRAKQDWLAHWEQRAVHLAAAMAGKILRRKLDQEPEITLQLVREALELVEGNHQIQLRLSEKDLETLGPQVKQLTDSLTRLGNVKIVADAELNPGGCRIETRRGSVDNTFDAQLARIEEELT
ncbi:MAG: hypothetical protein DWQ31_17810 [Planctomycetota bacterium]|nr:MAG: hypothetical protein DWQ31_17810 [Planctomycetota bacterium]REJ94387.1 MAG: hypothetical protein DWQ35_08290 [Planctomycetota bacterium]REK22080.1 MAG: hypothetical protein DWQ42_18235 [Planctomycetota bacterium]REK44488.1 MAG: hypothetical protein DWQ46_09520 [Planctomycetota bacterium]